MKGASSLRPLSHAAEERVEVWREPVRGGYPELAVLALPGIERLRRFRMLGAPPPPLFHLTGAQPIAFGDGTAEATMPASPWLLNSAGVIGGGTLAILADIAFGCSVETQVPAATPYTTAELSLTFLRPAREGGVLTAAGQAIHVGRSTGLSEVFVLDSEKRLIAHGTSRLAILPKRDDLPEPPDGPVPYRRPEYSSPDPYARSPVAGESVPPELWRELTGAEVLAKQIGGELRPPPIHHLTGLRLESAGGGAAQMVMPASEWLASPSGRLQGGTLAMLADSAMQAAVVSTAPAATAVAGLDLKVNFLRPGIVDGHDLRARAEVVHAGRTLAITRAEVANADGKALVLATGSSMFLHDRPASLGEGEFPEAVEG
jgi:uncharacterized protein (TIGR00369 family)